MYPYSANFCRLVCTANLQRPAQAVAQEMLTSLGGLLKDQEYKLP